MIIYVGIGQSEVDLPRELQERRATTFAEFHERFPDSTFIKAIPAPESDEEIEAFLREHFSPGADQLADLQRQMVRGDTAVAVLAAFVGKHVPQVWARLGVLPLEFGDPSLQEIERAAARDAIGRSAVWESSALYVAGGLCAEVEEPIRGALPGSAIAQSVLDDASAGADQPFDDKEGIELGWWDAATNRPQVTEVGEGQRQVDRLSTEGVLRLARSLRTVPDTDLSAPGRFDELLTGEVLASGDLAFRTWVASFAVAERLGLPLYSDDRFVRAHAHGAGIPTFGTPALLDALVERGLLERDSRDRALRRLRVSGGMGLAPDPDQLAEEAEETDWDVNMLVARALVDPTAWRDPAALTKHVSFLRHAFHGAPTSFARWVARVLDAGRSVLPREQRARIAPSLLAFAWLSGDPDFARALLRVLRLLEPMRDHLTSAFEILGSLTSDAPPPVRLLAIKAAFSGVDHADHMRLMGLLRFD